jgi:hypothetical protein
VRRDGPLKTLVELISFRAKAGYMKPPQSVKQRGYAGRVEKRGCAVECSHDPL